jgi:hypothetical protein
MEPADRPQVYSLSRLTKQTLGGQQGLALLLFSSRALILGLFLVRVI